MKMNHNYKQAYLSMRCAPPPWRHTSDSGINLEEGVERTPSFSKEGVL